MIRRPLLISISFGAVLLLSCGHTPDIAGGSSTETGNPSVVGLIYNSDGTPAVNAKVKFVPADFTPGGTLPVDSAFTNDTGAYAIDSLQTNTYNLLATGSGGLGFKDSVQVNAGSNETILPDTLKSPGGLCGVVRLLRGYTGDSTLENQLLVPGDDSRTVLILFIGTNTWTVPSDSIGNFSVGNLADGKYSVRILTLLDTYAPKDTVLSVTAGKIDTLTKAIVLQYTGITVDGTLTGYAIYQGRGQRAGILISIKAPGVDWIYDTTDANGRYAFFHLTPKAYTVYASDTGKEFLGDTTRDTVKVGTITVADTLVLTDPFKPVVTVTYPAEGDTLKNLTARVATFSGIMSDAGSQIVEDSVKISLNGKPISNATVTLKSWAFTVNTIADGHYRITVDAKDSASNAAVQAVRDFCVNSKTISASLAKTLLSPKDSLQLSVSVGNASPTIHAYYICHNALLNNVWDDSIVASASIMSRKWPIPPSTSAGMAIVRAVDDSGMAICDSLRYSVLSFMATPVIAFPVNNGDSIWPGECLRWMKTTDSTGEAVTYKVSINYNNSGYVQFAAGVKDTFVQLPGSDTLPLKFKVIGYDSSGDSTGWSPERSLLVKTSVNDIDGNVYHVVLIGTQLWMQQNLKTTRYNDGTPIPLVTDNTAWFNLATPAYCWYNNDSIGYRGTPYGALYNFYSVNRGTLAPKGWHVPTDSEWSTLTNFLGGQSVAGGALKDTGTEYWSSPNFGATNETGFSALPGGYRNYDGTFTYLGRYGDWWSSTSGGASLSFGSSLGFDGTNVGRAVDGVGNYDVRTGLSVRCVRDQD